MNRDIICLIRLLIDRLPSKIRNSKFLFRIAQSIFGLPSSLFDFRENYDNSKYKNLSKLYKLNSNRSLERISKSTDINSFHLRIIKKIFKKTQPFSILDVGCGTGYLLDQLYLINNCIKLSGIDFNVSSKDSSKINFFRGDILQSLKKIPNNSFELVTCTHVIEHLPYPEETLSEIRRISANTLIIICPIEKKHKWGMNYHINFFTTTKSFLNFCIGKNLKNHYQSRHFEHFYRLGDLMYVEYII